MSKQPARKPRPRSQTVLACEEINFIWGREEIEDFHELWEGGFTLKQIASCLKRPFREVVALAVDQISQPGMRTALEGVCNASQKARNTRA